MHYACSVRQQEGKIAVKETLKKAENATVGTIKTLISHGFRMSGAEFFRVSLSAIGLRFPSRVDQYALRRHDKDTMLSRNLGPGTAGVAHEYFCIAAGVSKRLKIFCGIT